MGVRPFSFHSSGFLAAVLPGFPGKLGQRHMAARELLDHPPFTLVGRIPNTGLEVWNLVLFSYLKLDTGVEAVVLLEDLCKLQGSDLGIVVGETPVLSLVATFKEC